GGMKLAVCIRAAPQAATAPRMRMGRIKFAGREPVFMSNLLWSWLSRFRSQSISARRLREAPPGTARLLRAWDEPDRKLCKEGASSIRSRFGPIPDGAQPHPADQGAAGI